MIILVLATLLFFIIILLGNAEGAAFTSKATGNWDAEGQTTWNEAGHPGSGDTTTVQNTHTVTLDSATVCTTLTIDSGGVLTDATNNVGIAVSGVTTVTGTLTCGSGAMSFGSGLEADNYSLIVAGTFTGGSGTHTIGSIGGYNADSLILSSWATTTDSAKTSTNMVFTVPSAGTFTASGTLIFTRAGNQLLYDINNNARTFGAVTLNKASGTVQYYNGGGFALTVTNNFTITAGTFSTVEETSGTSRDLTITGDVDITGTLIGNASPISVGGLTINAGGTLESTSENLVVSGDIDIDSGATFNHHNGVVNASGPSLYAGGKVFHDIIIPSATTVYENVSAASIWCNGSLDINAGKVLTFTSQKGFENSTGIINLSGTAGNYAYITGPSNWTINGTAMNSSYWWVYANITNGYNYGTGQNGTIVFLGHQNDCHPANQWDTSAPLISPVYIYEGMSQNTYHNSSLLIHAQILDTTYLRYVNYTIICVANGTTMANGSVDLLTNMTLSYWLNETIDVSGWAGNFTIWYNATDAHNPTKTKKAKERAESMVCDVNGDLVGKKAGKKESKDREGKEIKITHYDGEAFHPIYSIIFPDYKDSDVKHSIKWDDVEMNFKLLHNIKLHKEGNDYDTYVMVNISAAHSLMYLLDSSHYIHLLIDDVYFYDADDFRDGGGTILVEQIAETSILLRFSHPHWGQEVLVDGKTQLITTAIIDPLSGSVNENPEQYNFTLFYLNSGSNESEVVESGEGLRYYGNEEPENPADGVKTWTLLTYLAAILICLGVGSCMFYLAHEETIMK